MHTINLNQVRRGDVTVAGGKGANLGELLGQGFPVPPGFIIPAGVCAEFFERIGLNGELTALRTGAADEIPNVCSSIRRMIVEGEVPSEWVDATLRAHDELTGGKPDGIVCAVRSSATAEDLGSASFAGQHATYYYVEKASLLEMVKHCWASLFTFEAVSYRIGQGLDHRTVFMAVVVQEMIRAELSGITFTANPVTGSRDEIVIETSWGMGAAIVDGRVTPDRYIVHREGLAIKEKRIALKRFMVPAGLTGENDGRLEDVPQRLRQKETLTPEQVRMAAEWAIKAEEHFGAPQDVEWAINNGRYYMLQSRPITVMGREDIGRGVEGQLVLFKPLVENFTDPLTPLTGDFVTVVAPPMLRVIKGWAYGDLRYFRPFFPFKVSDEELAGLLYEMGSQPPSKKVSFRKLPLFLFIMMIIWAMTAVLCARTKRLPDDFLDEFRELCRKIENDSARGPESALRELWAFSWQKFFAPVGRMPVLVNITTGRYMIYHRVLQRLMNRWIPDLGEETLALLCSGAQGVLSAEMGRGIWNLAQAAGNNKVVRDILKEHKPEKWLAELRAQPEAGNFMGMLDDFLAVNGHRALKELEIMSERWSENPGPVLGMIRNFLLVNSDPTEHDRRIGQIRSEIEKKVRRELLKNPLEASLGFRWRITKHMASRIKYFTKMRENTRFYHVMAFDVVRKKILKMEEELLRRGGLKCKDDIFFLKFEEISDLLSGEFGWRDVEDRIRRRRIAYIRHSKMTPPITIGVKSREGPDDDETVRDEAMLLRGQAASPGCYEGRARVILDPSADIELQPGEILVAPYTDPAWTPLFLTAGAAVVEVGSYLSHAGTVAREYGMPCVVDVTDCTKRVQTGWRLIVDGDKGLVTIVEAEGRDEACQSSS